MCEPTPHKENPAFKWEGEFIHNSNGLSDLVSKDQLEKMKDQLTYGFSAERINIDGSVERIDPREIYIDPKESE